MSLAVLRAVQALTTSNSTRQERPGSNTPDAHTHERGFGSSLAMLPPLLHAIERFRMCEGPVRSFDPESMRGAYTSDVSQKPKVQRGAAGSSVSVALPSNRWLGH